MAHRVVLHVGTPKSGTTYLQSALWAGREDLAGHRVHVPGEAPFDHNRASIAVRNGLHLGAGVRDRRARVWTAFTRAAEEVPGTVVLSNEWWVSASRPQAEAAVAQLGGDRVHVVVTTRPLVRLVPAAWQESLKVGRGHPLGDFVADLATGRTKWAWEVLDPAVVARAWAEVVGPDRVHVVTMPARPEHPGQLWERFTGLLGLAPDAVPAPSLAANESLSVQAARLLQEHGPALREEVDAVDASWRGHARWLRNAVVRDVLVDVPGDPIGVGPALAAALEEKARDGVAALRALGCPVVGDLDELLGATDRPGARHPDDVAPAELLDASRVLATGLLRERIRAAAADAPDGDDGPGPGGADAGRADARRPADPPRGPTRRWTFLVPSAYAAGGIARTVFTTANVLVGRGHEVEVVTLVRPTAEPALDLHPDVRLVPLHDRFDPERPDVPRPPERRDPNADPTDRALDAEPSQLVDGARKTFSRLADHRLERHLRAAPPGVVVSTRPEFAVAASRWCDPRSVLLHQEHLSFVARPTELREALRAVARGVDGARRLDALLTLTEADLRRWREYLDDDAVRTAAIPNATPFAVADPAPLTDPVVVAAGRMTRQKGFERLIDAWAPLARSHPDWQLRIFGDGPRLEEHREQAAALGVGDRVVLPGVTRELERELAGAAVYAMSSRYEGLPMVLIEAMSKGVPPVSFDCPEGPRQLIDDDINGLLVPRGDVDALGVGLRRLMDDADLRRRLGAGALETARGFEADSVVDRWLDLAHAVEAARG